MDEGSRRRSGSRVQYHVVSLICVGTGWKLSESCLDRIAVAWCFFSPSVYGNCIHEPPAEKTAAEATYV